MDEATMDTTTRHRRTLRAVAGLGALLLLGVLSGAAMAGGGSETVSGNNVAAVSIARGESGEVLDTGTGPHTLSGVAATISVPTGKQAILNVTFSGETSCYDSGSFGWCGLRIYVNGAPAAPDSDFAFDSSDSNVETESSWESHIIQRSTGVLTEGSYTVTVEVFDGSGAPMFWYDDWHLTVERVVVPV